MKDSRRCMIRHCTRAKKDCKGECRMEIRESQALTHLKKVIKTIKTKKREARRSTLQRVMKGGVTRRSWVLMLLLLRNMIK